MRRTLTSQPEQNARVIRNLRLSESREVTVVSDADTKRVHHGLKRNPTGWLVVDTKPAAGSMSGAVTAYNSVGGTTFNTVAVVPLDQTPTISSLDYTVDGTGEVTVLNAGLYEIHAENQLDATAGSSRSQADTWLELNTLEIGGTRFTHYCRQSSFGASGSTTRIISLNADSVIRMRAQRTGGTSTISNFANGSRMTIKKLAPTICRTAWTRDYVDFAFQGSEASFKVWIF